MMSFQLLGELISDLNYRFDRLAEWKLSCGSDWTKERRVKVDNSYVFSSSIIAGAGIKGLVKVPQLFHTWQVIGKTEVDVFLFLGFIFYFLRMTWLENFNCKLDTVSPTWNKHAFIEGGNWLIPFPSAKW